MQFLVSFCHLRMMNRHRWNKHPLITYSISDVREINDERWFTILNPWDGNHSLSRDERENRDDMEQLSSHVNSLDLRERTGGDRKSTRLNSSHSGESRMPSSA